MNERETPEEVRELRREEARKRAMCAWQAGPRARRGPRHALAAVLAVALSAGSTLAMVATGGTPALATAVREAFAVTKSVSAGINPFFGISCAGASTCVVVGADTTGLGDAFHTSSGGTSWSLGSVPQVGTSEALDGVSCASTTACVAVGQDSTAYGLSLGSADGGATWAQEGAPSGSVELSDVSCGSVSACVAAAYGPSPTNPSVSSYSLDATTNAGATWSAGTLPAALTPLDYVGGTSCASATDCVAVGSDTGGPVALYSTGGGAAWSLGSLPAGVLGLNGVSCPSTTTCLAVGTTASGPAVVTTTNSGASWSSILAPSGASYLMGVSCGSTTACVAVQDNVAFYTSTFGTSWSSGSALPAGTYLSGGVSCGTGAACAVAATGASSVPEVLFSTNGGATWTVSVLPQGAEDVSATCTSTTCLAGFGGFGSPRLYGSTNGGASWIGSTLPAGLSSILSMSCGTVSTCAASAYSGTSQVFLTTTTSGGTWTSHAAPSGFTYIGSVACTSGSACVALMGTASATDILTSSNGGVSWTVHSPPSGVTSLYDLTCSTGTSATCLVAAHNSTSQVFYASTNTGVTWNKVASPVAANTYLTSLDCISGVVCNAVDRGVGTGPAVALEYSNDGGAGWSTRSVPAGLSRASAFECTTSTSCTVAGSTAQGAQEVFASGDGGATWTVAITPSGLRQLSVLACATPTVCVVAGALTGTWALMALGPGVSGIAPNTGPTAGGTTVTITGAGFTAVSGVTFGGVAASGVTVYSTTLMAAVAPAHAAGTVDVQVLSGGMTSAANAPADDFLYVDGGPLVSFSPVRVADTRAGAIDPTTYAGKTLHAGGVLDVKVTNANGDGVPATAGAVVANVTAVGPSAAGYLTIWPAGLAQPYASSLNFAAHEAAVANLVEIPIGAGGAISIFNFAGLTDVLVDVEGYVPAGMTSGATLGLFNPVTPARVADTRPGSGYQGANHKLSPGSTLTVQMTGSGTGEVPTGAAAVVVNLTATDTTANGGYLVAYPAGATMPSASTVNFGANQSVPNRAIVALSSSGKLDVTAEVSAADVIVDVTGWFTGPATPSPSGYLFHPVSPSRIADTRPASGYQGAGSFLFAGQSATFTVGGYGSDGVPPTAKALVANVTVTNTTANGGYLSAYGAGASMPPSSDLNWSIGETVPNCVVTPLGTGSAITVTVEISGADVIVDVNGWYG